MIQVPSRPEKGVNSTLRVNCNTDNATEITELLAPLSFTFEFRAYPHDHFQHPHRSFTTNHAFFTHLW